MNEQKYIMDSYGRIAAANMGLARYIKAEDLFKCETCKHGDNGICNSFMWCEFHEEYRPDMRKLKVTEDVQEAKHGHWIEVNSEMGIYRCSQCREIAVAGTQTRSRFCPNCGAKMDGDGNNDEGI